MGVDSMVVRRPSHGFGWVDRRMVSEGHLVRLNQAEVVVYLVLCVVADRHRISYYRAESLARLVKLPSERVRSALERLVQQEFIAVEGQFIQVLDLDVRKRTQIESAPQEVSAPLERELENSLPERNAGQILRALPCTGLQDRAHRPPDPPYGTFDLRAGLWILQVGLNETGCGRVRTLRPVRPRRRRPVRRLPETKDCSVECSPP